jgi:PIN domain nuclease of toxin-antitoxin system
VIALDTHVVVWLYQRGSAAVGEQIAARLDTETVRLAPPVRLELTHLHEIGRLRVPAAAVIGYLSARLDVGDEDLSAAALFEAATPLQWARDPFDRLICAHSAVLGIDLVTRDRTITDHHRLAVW